MRPRPTIRRTLPLSSCSRRSRLVAQDWSSGEAREVELPRQSEEERDRVFRNGAFVGALGGSQPNTASHEKRLVVLIRAGAEGLHEAQLRRGHEQRVAPQT